MVRVTDVQGTPARGPAVEVVLHIRPILGKRNAPAKSFKELVELASPTFPHDNAQIRRYAVLLTDRISCTGKALCGGQTATHCAKCHIQPLLCCYEPYLKHWVLPKQASAGLSALCHPSIQVSSFHEVCGLSSHTIHQTFARRTR